MAYRTLEITLMSAKDLKEVNLLSKMDVYAVVSISGDHRSKQRTQPDRVGGRNPTWNSTFRFTIPAGDPGSLSLHILLRAERALGDRDVGEVYVPLRELLAGASDGPTPVQFVSYQVRKPSSHRTKGVLNFSYKLGEKVHGNYADQPAAYSSPMTAPRTDPPVTSYPAPYPPQSRPAKHDEPVTAYPVGGSSAAYAPPGASAGYPSYGAAAPYPHPSGYPSYGAAPPQYGYAGAPPYGGYGYGQPPRRNKFGMGLGTGLLGGALGGLLLGDMIGDAGGYDAGYDAGFGDGGGFDGGGFDGGGFDGGF